MPNPINDATKDRLCLKEASGWFVAGASFRRALWTLSDGAFKLFAHLCLEADRRTGRLEAVQGDLAKAIGKSRRIVGKYIDELKHKQVCVALRFGRSIGRIAGLQRSKASMARFVIRTLNQSEVSLLPSAALSESSVSEMINWRRAFNSAEFHWK